MISSSCLTLSEWRFSVSARSFSTLFAASSNTSAMLDVKWSQSSALRKTASSFNNFSYFPFPPVKSNKPRMSFSRSRVAFLSAIARSVILRSSWTFASASCSLLMESRTVDTDSDNRFSKMVLELWSSTLDDLREWSCCSSIVMCLIYFGFSARSTVNDRFTDEPLTLLYFLSISYRYTSVPIIWTFLRNFYSFSVDTISTLFLSPTQFSSYYSLQQSFLVMHWAAFLTGIKHHTVELGSEKKLSSSTLTSSMSFGSLMILFFSFISNSKCDIIFCDVFHKVYRLRCSYIVHWNESIVMSYVAVCCILYNEMKCWWWHWLMMSTFLFLDKKVQGVMSIVWVILVLRR